MGTPRTALGLVTMGLVLSVGGCGGAGKATSSATDTPLVPVSSPSPSAPSTPVDPAAVVKAKVMSDYKTFVATRSRGIVSNNPTFPYEQVMTGNALSTIKSVMTGSRMAGTTYSGGLRFVKGHVSALNLRSKPATAIVQACVFDGLKATSKTGKVTTSSGEISKQDRLVLIAGHWKATETQSLEKGAPGCA